MGDMICNDGIFKFKRRFELGNQVASLDVEMLACHIKVSKLVLQFLALKCLDQSGERNREGKVGRRKGGQITVAGESVCSDT